MLKGILECDSKTFYTTWAPHCYAWPMVIDWLIDEKNELILWKLSSIWMKILNDITCNFNWIESNYDLIRLKFNSIQIQLKRNDMQIGEECSKKKFVNMVLEKRN
jgi:hypothetical protein